MLTAFRNYSIQKKLMAMSLWAASGALLLASAAFTVYDFVTYRTSLVRSFSTVGEIISLNAASAMMFNDPVSAARTLESLKARRGVLAAALYTPEGGVFARWPQAAAAPLPPLPYGERKTHRFHRNRLVLFHPMILDRTQIGTVYIESDLNDLTLRLKRYAVIAAVVLVISFFVAAAIASKVGRKISQPILDLTKTAKVVANEKDYSVRAAGDTQGEIGLLIGTFNDMLAKLQQDGEIQKRSQAEIQQLNEQLEQKVIDRTAQLTSANKELEAFSYSVSHDLRAPLRAIDGFSRELLENSQDRLDDQGKSDLRRILAATRRMSDLIDDLLKLSRVTRSEMRREEVSLSALAEKVLQDLKTASPDRQVEFRITPGLTAMGDLQLLRVAFENLLGNAWKFTGKRAQAIIEFGATEREGKTAYFIRDNGAGFNMAYAGKLFGAFQRLHDAKDFPGTGIGLATVQRIILRHGGEIWVEGEVDRGATVTFTLS